ncbi:MAG: serine/threonine protein kinase [Actinomycetota bacterium]|nr:serine/threonine protein kinase [Actinomycetota bacterium]
MLDRIGSGGMGVVWQARDERLQRLVAVKQLLLAPDLNPGETEEARLRALREARIAARLQHPNAIVVYDVAEHDGEPCLVMEYLPARSLAAVLNERCFLPVGEVASIGAQVASALAAAHAAQIVHRDVKPGNILITNGGTAKITDFGVSRAAGDVTVTQTGMMAGTPAYLAPEVARGQVPTTASDVFSLGATLYAAVEGRAPFGEGNNQLALLHAVAAGEVPPPLHAGPLFAVLMSLLAKDPAARPDMHRAGLELELAAASSTGPVRRPPAAAARPTRVIGSVNPVNPVNLSPTVPSRPLPVSLPTPGRPLAGPPPAGPLRRERQTAGVLVGVVLTVLALAGIGTLVTAGSSGDQGTPSVGQTATSAAAPPVSPLGVLPVLPQVQPVDHSQGSIAWRDAGQLVIDYYNGLGNLSAAWQMLSPTARATFDNEVDFRSHWSRYSSVSARNASGVTDNPDGSVTVPVDVVYDTGSGAQVVTRELRVTQRNGQLLIDSDPR